MDLNANKAPPDPQRRVEQVMDPMFYRIEVEKGRGFFVRYYHFYISPCHPLSIKNP